MKTMKKIIGWVLFGIAFIIVSELVINVSLNSSYKDMSQKSSLPTGVSVYQAESTLVNGRIRGNVENTGNPNIEGKYLTLRNKIKELEETVSIAHTGPEEVPG